MSGPVWNEGIKNIGKENIMQEWNESTMAKQTKGKPQESDRKGVWNTGIHKTGLKYIVMK